MHAIQQKYLNCLQVASMSVTRVSNMSVLCCLHNWHRSRWFTRRQTEKTVVYFQSAPSDLAGRSEDTCREIRKGEYRNW